MSRPDQGEVAAVKCGDLVDIETLGDRDHGHVGRIEARVLVEPDEFGHTPHICSKQIDQLELLGYKIKKLGVYGRPMCLLIVQPASIKIVEGRSSGPSNSSKSRTHEVWCLSSRSTTAIRGPVSRRVAVTLID